MWNKGISGTKFTAMQVYSSIWMAWMQKLHHFRPWRTVGGRYKSYIFYNYAKDSVEYKTLSWKQASQPPQIYSDCFNIGQEHAPVVHTHACNVSAEFTILENWPWPKHFWPPALGNFIELRSNMTSLCHRESNKKLV